MNRWHSMITFLIGWAHNNSQSASQYETEEYTLKLNKFRGRNLTHCWGNDPFRRSRFTQVSLAIIKSKFLDGLCYFKDEFFQCLNLSGVSALFFVTFLICKMKSSNTVTASYNYIKYFQVINQPVSCIQFILRMRKESSRRPQMVSRVFIG